MKLLVVSNLQLEQLFPVGKYSVREKCNSVRRQSPVERAIEQVTRWEVVHRKGVLTFTSKSGPWDDGPRKQLRHSFRQKMFSLSSEVEDKRLSKCSIDEHDRMS